jgi:hypothetical protein
MAEHEEKAHERKSHEHETSMAHESVPLVGKEVKTPKRWRAKTDGPDAETAKPVEGAPTVETSLGQLDLETVMMNRVGGVGVVHMHSDPSSPHPVG